MVVKEVDEDMKCPFRKRVYKIAGRNSGSGYPTEWIENEEFEDCVGRECAGYMSFVVYVGYKPVDKEGCALCHLSKNINAKA